MTDNAMELFQNLPSMVAVNGAELEAFLRAINEAMISDTPAARFNYARGYIAGACQNVLTALESGEEVGPVLEFNGLGIGDFMDSLTSGE